MYGGGFGELGVGRGQIEVSPPLFHADAPNDVAPSAYNKDDLSGRLPASPRRARRRPGSAGRPGVRGDGRRKKISERRGPESNRCTRLCRPLPNHSATAPQGQMVSAGSAFAQARAWVVLLHGPGVALRGRRTHRRPDSAESDPPQGRGGGEGLPGVATSSSGTQTVFGEEDRPS